MAFLILQEKFEQTVRARLGVSETELPDAVINDRMVAGLAEKYIIKRVPHYATIVDEYQRLMLERAVISYICYLLAPTMPRRLNIEVATIDVKWKRERVDWAAIAKMFLADVEECLLEIVPNSVADHPLGAKANWSTEKSEE